jgi:hypothetical protein
MATIMSNRAAAAPAAAPATSGTLSEPLSESTAETSWASAVAVVEASDSESSLDSVDVSECEDISTGGNVNLVAVCVPDTTDEPTVAAGNGAGVATGTGAVVGGGGGNVPLMINTFGYGVGMTVGCGVIEGVPVGNGLVGTGVGSRGGAGVGASGRGVDDKLVFENADVDAPSIGITVATIEMVIVSCGLLNNVSRNLIRPAVNGALSPQMVTMNTLPPGYTSLEKQGMF